MNKTYTVYNQETGIIARTIYLENIQPYELIEQLNVNVKDHESCIEGDYSKDEYKIEGGAAVALPPSTDTTDIEAELRRFRSFAVREIDVLRGETRAKFITVIPGQEAMYISKRNEALGLILEGETADPLEFPLLASEVGTTASTIYEVAQIVLNLNWEWKQLAKIIEQASLQAKNNIAAAQSVDEIKTIVEDLTNQLNEISTT